MRKIKTKDIDPKKLITKSEYARQIGVSPTSVQNMIERGELTIVIAKGAELIHL
jgi:DNA-binding XRE family transcriptional regulator